MLPTNIWCKHLLSKEKSRGFISMIYKNKTEAEPQEGEEYFLKNVSYGRKHATASKKRTVFNKNIYTLKKSSIV